MRAAIAHGKAKDDPAAWGHAPDGPCRTAAYFVSAINGVAGGDLVPVPGGVLIKEGDAIIGVIGISGDTSDNDEAAAVAGINAAGLTRSPDDQRRYAKTCAFAGMGRCNPLSGSGAWLGW